MHAITFSELRSGLGERKPPIVLDVRRQAAYRESTGVISGALRRDPDGVAKWVKALPRGASVVAYCVRGHEVSQSVVKMLNEHEISARDLEGGIEDWQAKQGPLDR